MTRLEPVKPEGGGVHSRNGQDRKVQRWGLQSSENQRNNLHLKVAKKCRHNTLVQYFNSNLALIYETARNLVLKS